MDAHPAAAGDQRTASVHALTFRRGHVSNARFAPDGQSLVYSATWDGDPERIYPLRLDRPRAESQPIVDAALSAVSASGDMAVQMDPQLESVFTIRGTLGEMALGGGQPRPLLDRIDDAAYAPDGRIAVVRSAEGRTRLEFPAGTVLFETAGWISSPRFCPDGSCIAFHRASRWRMTIAAGRRSLTVATREKRAADEGVRLAGGPRVRTRRQRGLFRRQRHDSMRGRRQFHGSHRRAEPRSG